MDTQGFGAPPSGLPPLAWLSGLNLGNLPGMSGQPDVSMSGTMRGGGLGSPGSEGMGLDALSQLLAAQSASEGAGAAPSSPIGTGTVAQSGGTLGQAPGGFSGGYGVAGQTAGGGQQQAAQQAAGSADPLAIIQKLLGVASGALKGAGLATGATGGSSGYQTAGDTGQGAAGGGVGGGALPSLGGGLTGFSQGQSFQDPNAPGLGPQFQDPNALGVPGGFGTGGTPDATMSFLQQFGQGGPLNADQAGIENFLSQGLNSDQISQLATGQGFEQTAIGGSASPFGGGGGGFGLGNAAAGLGGLQSLLDLVRGGMGGNLNAGSILQGIQGLYSGVTGALNLGSPIASYIASEFPSLASALVSAAGTGSGAAAGAAGGAAAAAAPAVSGALSALGAGAAPVIMAITAALSNAEEMRARQSGYANNPIAGGLSSAATSGVGKDLSTLQGIQAAGGIQAQDTQALMGALPGLINNLGAYYSTVQGPAGAIKASDSLTGLYGRPGTGGADQYTANAQQAQQGIVDVINELERRGVTYDQLGQLPVSGNFVQQNMNMDPDYLKTFYNMDQAKYNAGAGDILNRLYGQATQTPVTQYINTGEGGYDAPTGQIGYSYGGQTLPTGLTPMDLLTAAQGSAPYGPDSATHASGLITSMFGGPMWAALARMGNLDPGLTAQISQHFNPWSNLAGFNGSQLFSALNPYVIQPGFMDNSVGGGLAGVGAGVGTATGD